MKGMESRKKYYCSKCGKEIKNTMTVSNATRQNKTGRISWSRDNICIECNKQLKGCDEE